MLSDIYHGPEQSLVNIVYFLDQGRGDIHVLGLFLNISKYLKKQASMQINKQKNKDKGLREQTGMTGTDTLIISVTWADDVPLLNL